MMTNKNSKREPGKGSLFCSGVMRKHAVPF
nr:MAG TPA: hypothetical protein [Caudoviricetes sp.]